MSSPNAARRGRPRLVDPDAVVAAAIGLWSERGFERTSWSDIAAATGVSVRTLIRRFGSQAGILGPAIDAATTRLRAALDAAPADLDPSRAVRDAIVASVAGDAVVAHAAQWMRVVADEPALQAWLRTAYAPWIGALADALRVRVPGLDADTAVALASGYEAVANATLQAWARAGGEDSPAARLDAAIARIRVT